MSKRARIKLNPDLHLRVVPDTGTAQTPELEAKARKGPEVATSPPPVPTDKSLSAGTVFKVVLAGLAVVAVVLLLKGRRP